MRRPIIGVTCLVNWQDGRQMQNETYIQAVLKAGGIPVLLPAVEQAEVILQHLALIDGLLVSGGPDIDPQYFGEQPIPALGGVVPVMDTYEMRLLELSLEQDKPILGICRGEQVLNVAAGGTLYQDIYKGQSGILKHRQDAPRASRTHRASLAQGTKLAAILGCSETGVNSFHHQAVAEVAPGFVVSAKAPDGIIEAIESTTHRFVLGVQWHPEGMWNAVENYDALFAAFIEAAGRE